MTTNSNSSGKNTKLVAGSILFQFAMKLIRGLIIPKMMSPAFYGLFCSLNIIFRYGEFTDFGFTQHLSRSLPATLAHEGEDGFQRELNEGVSWAFLTAGAVAVILTLIALFYTGENAWFYRIALPIAGVTLIAQQCRAVLGTSVRAKEKFRPLSIGLLIMSGVGMLIAVSMLLLFGIFGLITALGLTEIVVIVYYIKSTTGIPKLSWIHYTKIQKFISSGKSLLVLSLLELFLATVDQLFILSHVTKGEYGHYCFGLFIATTVLSVSGIYLTVMHPKLMRLFSLGQNKSATELTDNALIGYLAIVTASLPLGYLTTFLVLSWYLPAYLPGMKIYLLMGTYAVLRGTVLILQPYFVAKFEVRYLVVLYGIVAILSVVLNLLVIFANGRIEMFLFTSMLTYFILSLVMNHRLDKSSCGAYKRPKYLFIALGCLIPICYYVFLGQLLTSLPFKASLQLLSSTTIAAMLIVTFFGFCFKTVLTASWASFWK